MLSHARLSGDGLVQRSLFANGAAITVNFADEARSADDTMLPPRSYLITGDAPELAGLPVGKPVCVNDAWQPKAFVVSGNTGFEQGPVLWRGSGGMDLAVQEAVVHGGKRAASITGSADTGWSYAVAPRVPVEPGRRYRLRGWLRVDAVVPSVPAPSFKCAIYSKGKWRANIYSSSYDVAKTGTWQELQAVFTAPEGADQAAMALEKRIKEPRTATLYIDDMELAPADDDSARKGKH